MRWIVLLIVSLIMAANYYFYDALSPLKEKMPVESRFFKPAVWIFAIDLFHFKCFSFHGSDWRRFA